MSGHTNRNALLKRGASVLACSSRGRDEVVAKRIAEAGTLYRPIMAKAYAGNCSPRRAIKAQCLICVGYQREDITHCTGYSCPLWAFRPYQNEGGKE